MAIHLFRHPGRPRLTPWRVALLCALVGCAPTWRPPLPTERADGLPAEFLTADYLPHEVGREWLYHRSSPRGPLPKARVEYRRVITETGAVDGRLVGRSTAPLSNRLPTGTEPDPQTHADVVALLEPGPGFVVSLEPPLPLFPVAFTPNEPVEWTARISYFDRNARRVYEGVVTRWMVCEGVESVTVPAGTFDACLRLRVEMSINLRWGPSITITEYIWLARGVGEVQRIEHITGLVWLIPCESTTVYRLFSYHGGPTSAPAPAAEASAQGRLPSVLAVKTSAILFDQGVPRPRIGGAYHELTTVPARRQ